METRTPALITAAALSLSAGAQTWTGWAGQDWLSAANWSPAVVPGFGGNRNAAARFDVPAGFATLTDAPDILSLDALVVTGAGMTVRFADSDAEIATTLGMAGRLLIEHGAFRSRVRFQGSAVTGGGEYVLDDGGVRGRAMLTLSGNPAIAPGTSIHGRGSLVGVCTNGGSISADQPGGALFIDPLTPVGPPLRNRGRLAAVGGGSLEVGTFEIDNDGGVIHAGGGTVHFRQGCDVVGGTVSTSDGGQVVVHDSVYTSGVAFAGDIFVADGGFLRFNLDNQHPTVVNSGVIHALNFSGGPAAATLNLRYATAFTGPGVLSLDGRTGLWTEALLTSAAFAGTLTNGPGHTVRGLGLVDLDLVNQGLVRVGYPGDVPNNDQATVMEFTHAPDLSGGTLEVPIAADGAHGTVVARTALTLAGALRVMAEDGPLPGPGSSWDIATAPAITGAFSSMSLPQLPPGRRWRAAVAHGGGSDALRITVACTADFNGDDFVDFFDYDAFVAAFQSGDPAADVNADQFVDFFDYDDFVAGYEMGC